MIDMAPHIAFNGRCKEALEFYTSCLQGRVRNCITFGEAKIETQKEHKDKILTAFFEAQGLMFYASDGFLGGAPAATESNIALQIESFDKDELKYIYSRFKESGKELSPLNDMQDGVLYGVVCDKYGVTWLFLGLN